MDFERYSTASLSVQIRRCPPEPLRFAASLHWGLGVSVQGTSLNHKERKDGPENAKEACALCFPLRTLRFIKGRLINFEIDDPIA